MGMREVEPEVRRVLPAEEFETAFAEGRAWPQDQAVMTAIELGKRHPAEL